MAVGLGGRPDASNTRDPDVAAITNLGLDHQEFLGETVEAVAAEKAAIIKPGGRAVTGAAGPALEVIRRRAASLQVPLSEYAALPIVTSGREGLVLRHERLGALRLPLVGRHQAANAGVALGVLDALEAADVASLPDDAIRAGLAATAWPGRLEIVEFEGTTVVLDGAHNPAGVAVLVSALEELAPELPPGPATLLLGVLRDKEVDEMVGLLAGCDLLRGACLVATTVPGTERALPANDLASAWEQAGGPAVDVRDDADAALDRALALAAASGAPLVIAGSLYLVGRLRARLVPGTLVDDAA
jgi:dihydrofolate synthase/folylpolyglutamate synthase